MAPAPLTALEAVKPVTFHRFDWPFDAVVSSSNASEPVMPWPKSAV